MWADPENPKWDDDVKFPLGTCVFKILLTDAKNEEVSTMQGAPGLDAVIAEQPKKGQYKAGKRNDKATKLRLLQVDFAVRDDRAEIGWVFGTFMYDGSRKDKNVRVLHIVRRNALTNTCSHGTASFPLVSCGGTILKRPRNTLMSSTNSTQARTRWKNRGSIQKPRNYVKCSMENGHHGDGMVE